jgi:hypothetical protein
MSLLAVPQALFWICGHKTGAERTRILQTIESGRPISLGMAFFSLSEIAPPELHPEAKVKIWDAANGDLVSKLVQGTLVIYGRRQDAIDTEVIPAAIFAGVKFVDNPDFGTIVTPGRWRDLSLASEAIESIWPLMEHKRGPKPEKRKIVEAAMLRDLKDGSFDLWNAKEIELEARYRAARDTCRKVRNALRAAKKIPTNNDSGRKLISDQ